MGSWAIFRDRSRRIRRLTPRRMRNALTLWRSHQAAKRGSGDEAHLMPRGVMPMSLSIEPTTACNLRCPECPSGLRSFTRPTGHAPMHQAAKWIESMADDLMYVNLYFQGEPLLHPELEHLIDTCRTHDVYSSTSTNAHHLTPERAKSLVAAGLNRLIISIDGASQESYSSYRVGGSLETVLEGTRNAMDATQSAGHSMHVVWQFLVVKPNEGDIPLIRQMARDHGVHELDLKTAQIDQPEDSHPLLATRPEHRRYDRDPETGIWSLRNAMRDECWRMWQGAVVTWDGKVVPCCFDKDAHHVMGNLNESSMQEVWHGERYEAFRRLIVTHRQGVAMCTNCSEGSHVYA